MCSYNKIDMQYMECNHIVEIDRKWGKSMATVPPFMNSTGLITKILIKIKETMEPPVFNTDFLSNVIGYDSGSARAFPPFAKRLGLLDANGTPTELYKKFRNDDTSGWAMAEAMRKGFNEIFLRSEYAYKLSDEKLKNIVVELTGRKKGDGTVGAICRSFIACKEFADFEADINDNIIASVDKFNTSDEQKNTKTFPSQQKLIAEGNGVGFNLAYTINLNLPETTDIRVFNAIFKSLKENLLQE